MLYYVTESILWGFLLAFVPTWPLLTLWVLCDVKKIERCRKFPREPYIIGDSTEIEYLTPEELEKRLKYRKERGNPEKERVNGSKSQETVKQDAVRR
ncbi:hypothetical protein [Thermococcus thermotolerans]|uniref:hypothetical protein n=1 Tax=Thermococcus thermotolerans TaxID=2969672 RepID=UPI0021581FB3|nr:hypothetical protein [Thermococcus thermotolerans]